MIVQFNLDEALAKLQQLAEKKPSVQSLNNLAYMYLREEEDRDTAEKLLLQALKLNPQSAYPYMMLGEIALHNRQYEQAKTYLQQAMAFTSTEEATYNLAIAYFNLGAYEQAAKTFACYAGDSDQTRLHEVVSWMYAGELDKARELLANWNEEADGYTGAIEIADVYVELGNYSEARVQFEKEWHEYYLSPFVISGYAYTLLQLEGDDACQAIIQQAIQQKKEEIKDELERELDEYWTVENRDEHIKELNEHLQELEALWPQLENGYKPAFDYDMYPN